MWISFRQRYLLLLLVAACSSSTVPHLRIPSSSSSSSLSRGSRRSFIVLAAAEAIERVPFTTATVAEGVIIKNTSKVEDRLAPAAVVRRYRPPGQGRGGTWDNFDYGDARNTYPTRYCPSSCRSVSKRISGCQCVTRRSLVWYYAQRRMGLEAYPTCCYLRPPTNGGGSSSWGGGDWTSSGGWSSSGGGSSGSSGTTSGTSSSSSSGSTSGTSGGTPPPPPTPTQTVSLQTYAVGQCTAGGMGVIETNLRGFIATMPGVIGSTVTVKTGATLMPMSVAQRVVAASAAKVQELTGAQPIEAQALSSSSSSSSSDVFTAQTVPGLPGTINQNIVCEVGIEAQFQGPAEAASLLKTLWSTAGICNKIFNVICASFYQLESQRACISEPASTPAQYGSCEWLSGATPPSPNPPSSPTPSPPPSPPPTPSPSPSPPPPTPSPSPPPPTPSPSPSPSPPPPTPSPSPPPPTPSPSPPPPTPSPSPSPPPPVPSPSPSPDPGIYNGDKVALLASVKENPAIGEEAIDGWKATSPLCTGPQSSDTKWTGIECADAINKPGVVGKINFNDNILRGLLPKAWADLKEVTNIEMTSNFMTGPLPDEWARLTSLKVLKLDWNRQTFQDPTAPGLSGSVPKTWAALTNLETLLLSGNDLSGTFPPELAALTKLTYLSVSSNMKLGGYIPADFKARAFNMSYADAINSQSKPVIQGPTNVGLGTALPAPGLWTYSGPLWRTNITQWEGGANNTAAPDNPKQPNPDPCVVNPNSEICLP